jgi:hypothetical protein
MDNSNTILFNWDNVYSLLEREGIYLLLINLGFMLLNISNKD